MGVRCYRREAPTLSLPTHRKRAVDSDGSRAEGECIGSHACADLQVPARWLWRQEFPDARLVFPIESLAV